MSQPKADRKERPGRKASSEKGSPEGTPAGPGAMESPYLWSGVAFLGVFFLYAVTLGPTTSFWDTSEYIATAHIMGIPHPPGNPLFVVLGRAWEILLAPLGLSVAVKINLFSAFMGALAHALWFLVVHRILSYFEEDRSFALIGAFVAVIVSATAFTVWNQSNVNEKVYTVSLMTIALLSWLVFHWRDNLGQGKDDNLLILMIFILALSVGNHLMAFLAAPALVVFIFLVHGQTLLNWKLYVAAVVVGLLGLSIHMFLPIRAALDPLINEADPTCRSIGSALVSVVSWGQAGCVELSAALAREQYDKPPLIPRQANFFSQIANYLQYFDWQWARSLAGENTVFAGLRLPFTLLFSALGLYGAAEHFKRDRKSWWYMVVLFATLSAALVFYLNFKYGYSLAAPVQDRNLHEVRERDYFFIVSFSIWGLWAGIGIVCLWRAVANEAGLGRKLAAPVLAIALLPMALNWSWASRADDYAARDWAYNLLQSVEPYGILFTNGDNDTFPLWYLQEVEGIRRDVTVIVISYLNTGWYAKQLRELTRPCPEGVDPLDDPTRIICQRPYLANTDDLYTTDPSSVPPGAVALELDEPVAPPTRTILDLDDETIDQVGGGNGFVPIRETRRVGLSDNVAATLRGGTILFPWGQFALSIIRQSMDDRPIYFASTTNSYREIGLTPYLYRQGLAYRLNDGLLGEDTTPEGVQPVPDSPLINVIGRWMDVERTQTLAERVFMHRGGLPEEWDFWPDHATDGIPNYYSWVYYGLAQMAAMDGRDEEVDRFRDRAEIWAELGN